MSKKMLKRSLALGALMAFVITGSAWAGDGNFPEETPYKGPVYMDELSSIDFDTTLTYKNITIDNSGKRATGDKECQAVVSMTSNDVLKAIDSITIIASNSGICSYNSGSNIYVSARDIAIKNVAYLSGIHLDTENSNINVGDFKTFSIGAKAAIISGSNHIEDGEYQGNGIRVNKNNAHVAVVSDVEGSKIKIDAAQSGLVVTSSNGTITLSAGSVEINTSGYGFKNDKIYKGHAIVTKGGGTINVLAKDKITITNENVNTPDYTVHAIYAKDGNINIGTAIDANKIELEKKADVIINGNVKTESTGAIDLGLKTANSSLNGFVQDTGEGNGTNLTLSNGAIWNNSGESNITALKLKDGIVKQNTGAGAIEVGTLSGNGTFEVADGTANQMVVNKKDGAELTVSTSDEDTSLEDLTYVAVMSTSTENNLVVAADYVEKTGGSIYEKISAAVNEDGSLGETTKVVDAGNLAANDMAAIALMSWRAEMNDMNKRMGELRNANGDLGVWVRMVRGESEYNGVKNQYNQYHLGYDEKLSVDKRWTVGAALSYTDAENSFAQGNGESTNKALSIYGSKLNDDGTFIDLIAKYARLENEFDIVSGMGDADYSTNGYSFSAEFGKRIQQGKGLWIEPQVELTYGKVSAVDYVTANGVNVAQDGMESLVGRIGFSLGKDIEKGNVYARASYLYDFDGETKTTLDNDAVLTNDLGGDWWEVGVGANINLSKATYIYADVEKTFGGEADTNWQWNLGVRYSF